MALRLLACSIFTISLLAQVQPSKRDPCEEPKNTIEMRDCAMKKYTAADAELNIVYKKLINNIDKYNTKNKMQFVAAQMAWIKYRDSVADFEASFYNGGTIKDQIRIYALIRITKARIVEINDTINNEFNR